MKIKNKNEINFCLWFLKTKHFSLLAGPQRDRKDHGATVVLCEPLVQLH
jgi:hypothetical protein